jgi:hypothetical protein
MLNTHYLPSTLTIIFFSFFISSTIGQDLLLKVTIENKIILSDEIRMDSTKTVYLENGQTQTQIIDNKSIQSISFNKNAIFEIITHKYVIERMECSIDSITKKKVFFHDENYASQYVEKNHLLGIIFNHENTINDRELNIIEKNYLNIIQAKPISIKLIKNDDTFYTILKVNSISEGKINFSINTNKIISNTFYEIDKTKKITFFNNPLKDKIKKNDYFVLTHNKQWVKISTINNIERDFVNIEMIYKRQLSNMNLSKNSITMLFFRNLEGINKEDYALPNYAINNENKFQNRNFSLDIKGGYGNWFGLNLATADQASDDYFNELKSGLSIDANFNYYFNNIVGLGLKFNHFNSSSSIQNITEDNIGINFIAGNFVLRSPIINNVAFFNVAFSAGKIFYNNNASINNQSIKIKGSTIGFYIDAGVDFFIIEDISLGLNSGIMLGQMNKAKFNKTEYNLKNPANFSRIDILLNLKFHF